MLENQFGCHHFKLVILGDYVLGPVILQSFGMLLEISVLELPTNPPIVLVLYDGNEVLSVSVRHDASVLPLFLFCVLGVNG